MNFILLSLLALSLSINSLYAKETPELYRRIAANYQLNERVFYSVALQESGKAINGDREPWPWTLNIDKQGYYFDDYHQCRDFLIQAVNEGKNVDIGLFQISWRWNKQYFSQPADLLDIYTNMNHAAYLLNHHLRKSNSIEQAVMDYHAPNKRWVKTRRNYLKRVISHYKGLL